MSLANALMILAISLTAAIGNTMFKLGATHDTEDDPVAVGHLRTMIKPVIIGGMAVYGVSQILWISILRVADLSLAYPLQVGLNFVFIMTVAWLHFREPISPVKLMGVVMIFGGIVVVGMG